MKLKIQKDRQTHMNTNIQKALEKKSSHEYWGDDIPYWLFGL